MSAIYDAIGVDYSNLRRPEPRIARLIDEALGDAETVLNVGAGAGSYEPHYRIVTAIEPSAEMIRQRSATAGKAVQGTAESLPFDDNSFDASMAVLTVHHWKDKTRGLLEMRRVTRGPIVILTHDPSFRGFWLMDYFPELVTMDDKQMPPITEFEKSLGLVQVTSVMIPMDCRDGFLYAYWQRPAAYLDPKIRAAMSSFWAMRNTQAGLEKMNAGLERLEADLASGRWAEKYPQMLELNELDIGYRLITSVTSKN